MRNYNTKPNLWGGDKNCEHEFIITKSIGYRKASPKDKENYARALSGSNSGCLNRANRIGNTCIKCNAYYGELGLEPDPYMYIAHLVSIFREVKRVLKKEGTLWINIADTYNYKSAGPGNGLGLDGKLRKGNIDMVGTKKNIPGIKPKDLIGIPWMLAFSLRKDSWFLRSDIIWHKTNAMPESVKDRPTRGHEYIFLLSKHKKYYYDHEAIKTPYIKDNRKQSKRKLPKNPKYDQQRKDMERWPENSKGAHRRTVWSMGTSQIKEAHYAAYPKELVRICMKAGCPKDGIVLDPFIGSGTTGIVAKEEDRKYIGFELSNEYCKIANERIESSILGQS